QRYMNAIRPGMSSRCKGCTEEFAPASHAQITCLPREREHTQEATQPPTQAQHSSDTAEPLAQYRGELAHEAARQTVLSRVSVDYHRIVSALSVVRSEFHPRSLSEARALVHRTGFEPLAFVPSRKYNSHN